ncbi:MAG: hypothetical protein COV67_03480 [Nitrospinae bacterium CG11_big_fil_rev_8_21_14_0_20_56_8]|nr:MAG: hypothetical protein COV67_03480 [Nitrospinae bacterium CG11_big_fil_rev_8_21_14_0_20_56_8]
MTPFDTFVVIVLSLSFLYSVFKGMIREIFSLVAYMGGYLMAVRYQDDLAEVLQQSISHPAFARIISFIGIYIITALIISLIGRAVRKLLADSAGLSGTDRVVGGLIGICKGVVIIVMVMFPLSIFPDMYSKVTQGSMFITHLEEVSDLLSRGVGGKGLIDKMPSMQGVKDRLEQLKKLKDLGDHLKDSQNLMNKPLDQYSDEDRKKLEDILNSVSKE